MYLEGEARGTDQKGCSRAVYAGRNYFEADWFRSVCLLGSCVCLANDSE